MIFDLDITLLRPFWLLVLLPFAGLSFWLLRRRARLGAWEKAANPALLQAMSRLGQIDTARYHGTPFILIGVAALTLLALAGPAVEHRSTQSFRNLDGVLFLVDVSASTTEHAEWHTAQTSARFAISGLGTRPVGLIVFAGDAYAAADMSADHLQMGQTLSLLDAETVPNDGSRPERALALAHERLSQAKVIAGDVILFTDGGGLSEVSLQDVASLASQNTRVSIVAIGEPTAQMQTHTAIGNGSVFRAGDTNALHGWLQGDARTRLEQQDFPLLFWHDLGRYLLWFVLVPACFLFRRNAV
ncbi:MAG: VWA domain-containing protein [Pseudomonadota bacterium]